MNDSRQASTERTAPSTARRRVLRAGAALTTTALGIAALGGQAAAHFPPELEIEIRPGSETAPINPDGCGMIPVAVLQTDEFDPTSEAVRYRFGAPDVVDGGGGARPVHDVVADVTGDGRDDRLLLFRTDETGFDGDESTGRLEWERSDEGSHGYAGTAPVTIVGRRNG